MTSRLLLLAPRINETGLQLLTVAHRRGLRVHTATQWRVPDDLHNVRPAHLYGGPLFADAVGFELDLAILEPPAHWLTMLPVELISREVEFTTLAQARQLRRPAFIKPPVDKIFPARIYPDGSGLPGPDALDDETPVLISDIVTFHEEYRLFVLDGSVHTASRYAVDAKLAVTPANDHPEVRAFAADLLAVPGLPSAAVVDVGLLAGGTDWAVVEANPAWASGGYACDPERVLDVVLRAAGPQAELRQADRPFRRTLPTVIR